MCVYVYAERWRQLPLHSTAFSFSFFFFQRLQSTNQPSNAGDLKQAESLKAPGNLTETLGALGSTAIFTIHFGPGGGGGLGGISGIGMNRERKKGRRVGGKFLYSAKHPNTKFYHKTQSDTTFCVQFFHLLNSHSSAIYSSLLTSQNSFYLSIFCFCILLSKAFTQTVCAKKY